MIRNVVVYGILIAIYRKIRRNLLPVKCSAVVIFRSGRIIIICGILIAMTKPLLIGLLPRNVKRPSTYAAGAQIKIKRTQDTDAYSNEFRKYVETF